MLHNFQPCSQGCRGQNNAPSWNITKHICHLIGHKFSQFQALPGHFVNKNQKLFSSFLGFKVIYQLIRNMNPKDVYLPQHN